MCFFFESHAYINLGYEDLKELGPGEIDFITPDGVQVPCSSLGKKNAYLFFFLWVYYGYPTSTYEGVNVEEMRYKCEETSSQEEMGKLIRIW